MVKVSSSVCAFCNAWAVKKPAGPAPTIATLYTDKVPPNIAHIILIHSNLTEAIGFESPNPLGVNLSGIEETLVSPPLIYDS
jgi:hypothetical protein